MWFRFGSDPDFLATLDDPYEETIPLLDVVAPLLHPVSSVEDLSAKWEEIVLLAETDQNTEVLIEQTRLIEHRVDGWGPLLIAGHADARPEATSVSLAHTKEDIERTIDAARNALK